MSLRCPSLGWVSALAALLLGVFGLQLRTHITRTSVTSDEPVHMLAGYRYWECGDFVINPEHPPLLKFLAAAPLRSLHLIEPDWPCGSRVATKVEVAYASAQFVARNGMDRILLPARAAAAAVSLLLAVLVCLLAGEMFGRAEALVALIILVFEPTVIAHGSLVTTDMALATTMVMAVYALYRYRRRPNVFRVLTAGLAVGLMLAVKHSGIVVLPILLILMLADELRMCRQPVPLPPFEKGGAGGICENPDQILLDPPSSKRDAGRCLTGMLRVALAYLVVLLVAVGVLWAAYGFRYYALPGALRETLSVADLFAAHRPEVAQSLSGKLVELLHQMRLFPESYTFGLADVLALGQRPTYLLGKVYRTGQWFYFPLAFAIKSSLTLLILLAGALLTPALYRTHPREMLFLLLPALAYFGVSLSSGLNIGVRHLLPVYPFFMVVAAAGACWWSRRHRWCLYGLTVLLVFHAVTAVRAAPSYLGFANELWGGTRNTYRLLNDSNADWGQNLKLVERYVNEHDIRDCWIAAIGMPDVVRPYTPCRPLPAYNWSATPQLVDLVPPVIEGTVFISAWELPPWGGHEYAALAETPPLDVIGGSVLVFRGRFAVPLAAALSYMARADQQIGWGRYEAALQDARKGVELGPDDPRTHWEFANALARNGLMNEARGEVEAARRLAPAGPAYFVSRLGG